MDIRSVPGSDFFCASDDAQRMADSPRTKTLIMVLPPTPSAGVRAAELAENGYFRTAKAIRRYSTHFFNTYSIMRRSILHLAIVAIAGLSFASAQAQDGSDAPILRDNRVDTAILSRPIDPKMDLSRLPLYLLRIYRQIPAAQQGYWIMQQDLNALFSQTDWYYNRAEEAASHGDGEPFRAVLKPDEQAFVDRVQARERELLKQNFTVPKGYRVNLRNLANPYQFEALPAGMQEALARNGFVIVPQNDIQLFHVYENNDYHNFPSFVTTDLHLQLFHMYFDFVLRQLEQEKLIPMLSTFAGNMYNHMKRQAETAPDAATRAAAEYNQTYYAVGCALLTGRHEDLRCRTISCVRRQARAMTSPCTTTNQASWLPPHCRQARAIVSRSSLRASPSSTAWGPKEVRHRCAQVSDCQARSAGVA